MKISISTNQDIDSFFQYVIQSYRLKTKPELVDVKIRPYSKSKAKNCFRNAASYVINTIGSSYILGYYVFHDVPIEHAWVYDDGYYDVTLKKAEGQYYKLVQLEFKDLVIALNKNHNYDIDLYSYFKVQRK